MNWQRNHIWLLRFVHHPILPYLCWQHSLGKPEHVVTLTLSNEALKVHGIMVLTQATPAVKVP